MKKCGRCNELKEYKEYELVKVNKDGYQNYCKKCCKEYAIELRDSYIYAYEIRKYIW